MTQTEPAEMPQQIKKNLLENLLSTDNISSYSGATASFHFAKQNSVFQKIKVQSTNIQPANFLVLILHNCIKEAGQKLQTDSKGLLVNIINHFSSAKHTEELKTIFDYENLLGHVGTR